VPRSIRLAEAPSYGQAIAEYDVDSRGAQAYRSVVDELLERLRLTPPSESGGANGSLSNVAPAEPAGIAAATAD
ncbi:MAG: chromosome partitioning protein, partial [Thermomicrobiales bacterium]|nr:chromosome partitioning protein [Thermomicrobiales bacterium]